MTLMTLCLASLSREYSTGVDSNKIVKAIPYICVVKLYQEHIPHIRFIYRSESHGIGRYKLFASGSLILRNL